MTDSSDDQGEAQNGKGWWHHLSKPLWGGLAIVAGAFGGALNDRLEPEFTGVINQYTETGEAVIVQPEVRPNFSDVWLPPDVELTSDEMRELSTMELAAQLIEMTKRGGQVFGTVQVEVLLKGNRGEEVRVTDIRPESECQDLGNGSLVKLTRPQGGPPPTQRMSIDVEDPSQPPRMYHPNPSPSEAGSGPRNYFDEQTIALTRNQKEYILIDLSATESVCSVDLVMTVIDRGERRTQRILGEGNEVIVAPANWLQANWSIKHMYMGGQMCRRWVEGSLESIHGGMEEECGPGNVPFQ